MNSDNILALRKLKTAVLQTSSLLSGRLFWTPFSFLKFSIKYFKRLKFAGWTTFYGNHLFPPVFHRFAASPPAGRPDRGGGPEVKGHLRLQCWFPCH